MITSKASVASVVVAPFVVFGIGLIGYQTYSMLTGKSFREINYEIGQLWASREEAPRIEPMLKPDAGARLFNRPAFRKPERPSELLNVKPIQPVKRKNTRLVLAQPQTSAMATANFDDLKSLSAISFNRFAGNDLLSKYYQRLDQQYLVNPVMNPQPGKWYVSFSFSPTLSYRSFGYDPTHVDGVMTIDGVHYIYGMTEEFRNNSDRSVTGFNIGIDLGRRLTPKLSISSGLHYAQYGEQLFITEADKYDPNYDNSGFYGHEPMYEAFSEEESSKQIPYTNQYAYFEVPLMLNYDVLVKEKSKVSLNGGVHLQKLDHVNALVYDFNSDYYYWFTHKNELFSQYGVGASAGFTLSQFVGERMELFLNPHFKTNLISTFKSPYPVLQRQYATGLRLGVKQQLF